MMRWILTPRKLAAWLIGLILITVIALVSFVQFGMYDISALKQHTEPVYRLLGYAMQQSVRQRSSPENVPELSDTQMILAGFKHYYQHCEQCHGGPGIAPEDFALGMTPVPSNLLATARGKPPEYIFWIIQNGIKMTGMPAWKYQLSPTQQWETVAFVKSLSSLKPDDYRQMRASFNTSPKASVYQEVQTASSYKFTSADPERGKKILQSYACHTCHVIPGITGISQHIGPPLKGIADQKILAGRLANHFDNMVMWLMHPTRIKPATAMPDLGIKEAHARDIAAYLFQLTESSGSFLLKEPNAQASKHAGHAHQHNH